MNVTYVEQKQREFANEKGELQYDFIVDDYNESLELFANDLYQKLDPDTASRLVTLCRIKYGNRTEVETALVSNLNVENTYLHTQMYLFTLSVVFPWSSN